MSYKQLYDEVQAQGDRISTKWIKAKVIELSPIKKVTEFWSGAMDPAVVRGFFVEGPFNTIPALALGESEALIGLSRGMCSATGGKAWRRAVLTKELMHCFDEPGDKADTAEKLDLQIERFSNPAAPQSQQFAAEQVAFWRALGVLCREEKRVAFKKEILEGHISVDVVATALGLPVLHARELMRDDFEDIIAAVMGKGAAKVDD